MSKRKGSTGRTLAIVGGASLLVGAAAVAYYLTTQGKGPCQPPVGGCPTGQYWNAITCQCVASGCPPQQCGQNQVWDPVLCLCADLIPSRIVPTNTAPVVNMRWAVGLSGYGSNASTDSACPLVFTAGGTTQTFTLKGKVTDSNGNPIAGIAVAIALNTNKFVWTFSSGCASGEFDVTAPAQVTTDSSGNFSIDFMVQMHSQLNLCLPFSGQDFNSTFLLQVTFSLPSVNGVSSVILATFPTYICNYVG